MKLLKLNVRDSVQKVLECTNTHEHTTILCISDEKVVGYGIYEDLVDLEKCKELNILTLPLAFKGGACVVFEDDINFLAVHSVESDFGKKIIVEVIKYLQTKGIQASLMGNDIVIYNEEEQYEKVGSYTKAWIEDGACAQFAVHLSFTVDNELIDQICTKNRIKIPTGLSKYEITREEILNHLYATIDELKESV